MTKTKTKPTMHRNGQRARDGEVEISLRDLPRAELSMSLLLEQSGIPFKMAYTASRNLDWIRSALRRLDGIRARILKEREDVLTDNAALNPDGSYVQRNGNIVWRDDEKGREATKRIRTLDEKLRVIGEEAIPIRVRPIGISALEACLKDNWPGRILDAPSWLLTDDFADQISGEDTEALATGESP